MIPRNWLEESAIRIAPYIQKTPITYDVAHNLYFKWENHQVTGSFKARGALNKVLSLQKWELDRGLVTASAGNHGQGVALAANIVGAKVVIFASEHAVPSKIMAMRSQGADIHLVPGGYGEAEQAGLGFATKNGAVWISPYNDGQVIAGQGTLALEILKEYPILSQSTWVVPAGGGGLISGIGVALKGESKASRSEIQPQLMAVQSETSAFLFTIFHKGSQSGVTELPSLADGLAGPVEDNAITIPLVKHYVDDFLLVTEEEIIYSIIYAWQCYHERIEGSAAVALAAILTGKVNLRPAVVIISGGNIQPDVHQQLINNSITDQNSQITAH